jgi:voltage-gated potassium channel
LWWAVQTVTTVDYGDLVPTSTAGQLIAALVMIGGIGFLTVIAAVITSTFIENARSRLDGTRGDVVPAKLDQICVRLDVIESALTNVRARDRDVRH